MSSPFILVVLPLWSISAAGPPRKFRVHGAPASAYSWLSIRCALTGTEYGFPDLRPVKLSTMSCLRTGPASGVRSRNFRAGLTTRRSPSGGCETVTAADCSVMRSPYDHSGVGGADGTHSGT